MRAPILAGAAMALLGCGLVSLPTGVCAQDGAACGTWRERLKQRWMNARQERSVSAAPALTGSRIDQPGDYRFAIVHDGLTRWYLVHVPRIYRATVPAPMVLAFHGGGGDMNHMAKDQYYGLISKSEATGYIMVFPNGFSRLGSGKFATWNAGSCCAGARDRNVDDVGFVRAMIGNLTAQLNIDRNRIYATGMTNGGMMAYRLACEMADTFQAIAAVAGTDNTMHCAPKVPVSILHIHARNDDHVFYGGGAGKMVWDRSNVSDFISVPATIAKWVE